MLNHILESKNYIASTFNLSEEVRVGVILGSGLGDFVNEVEIINSIDYKEIPNFPTSTVEGHSGKLILAKQSDSLIFILSGRFHYYEGYSLKEACLPIRVLKLLGVSNLLISNASGGLNPDYKIGDLMILDDHIHLFPDNPLKGKNLDEFGPRFPDMSEPYCNNLINVGLSIGEQNGFDLKKGVYVGTSGPTYETPSEYKYFRIIGGDAVGMSTTGETIVAIHSGMKVFAVSVISDMGVEGQIVEISHEEVQEVAKKVAPKLNLLFKGLIHKLHQQALDDITI